MILTEFIVGVTTVVTQPGQDGQEHIVHGVIKLSIVIVALTVIGPMLGICIRSIWTTLWSGTEYGTWPGLKKWIGRASMPDEESKKKLIVHPSAVNLIEKLKAINFQYPIVTDDMCPPDTMYFLDPSKIIYHPWQSTTNPNTEPLTLEKIEKAIAKMSGVHSTSKGLSPTPHSVKATTFKELGLCGMYPADMDCYCIAQSFHGGEHLWMGGELLSTLDGSKLAMIADDIKLHPEGTLPEGVWWEGSYPPGEQLAEQAMHSALAAQVDAEAIKLITTPHHPKTKKWGLERGEKHQAVLQLLNNELAPFHLEPDETWLEVLNPQKFTFDWLVDKLFQIIEDGDYELEE